MPSAARPFTTDLVTRLIARGVGVSPVTLHTGLSSQEAGEAPQAERYRVPQVTAEAVNATKARGGRVVAVGTTATRALETVVGPDGRVHAGSGWTERLITRDDPARVVDGLVTGWHDPEASHLMLVESVAGPELTPGGVRRGDGRRLPLARVRGLGPAAAVEVPAPALRRTSLPRRPRGPRAAGPW